MAGEVFKPKGVKTRGSFVEQVPSSQMGGAGKVDFEQDEANALNGSWTRRLVADPPGGFIFICHCGHKRRVVGEETNFFCERGGWTDGKTECDIEWRRMRKPTGEFDETGGEIHEDITEVQVIEVMDEFTGRKRKVKIDVPIFVGRRVGEVKREEFAKRKASGQVEVANPSNQVIQTVIKNLNEGKTAGDAVAQHEKGGKK
jgi:hypothetical protein